MEWINNQSPILLAFLATLITWGLTALGASMVFFFKTINKRMLNVMLGFASGVMIAASFWSLLAPAIEMAEGKSIPSFLVAAIGFLGGAAFLWIADKIIPHIHFAARKGESEGINTRLRRSILLVFSITLHNIPEGLAVGVAFGAAANGMDGVTVVSAMAVAIGIGLQNFPEGAAVSIPLRGEGLSRKKSFLYGQASGIVEPIAGVIGAALVTSIQAILPYALAFAAGAMIYVVVEELIPEAQSGDHNSTDIATLGCIIGFTIMMMLDVGLG
ncbi:ZIP family metal transporter [Clostridium cylindrosporum]|uniref:Putative divalent heavy-metal cations transporter n=1 Tax=Clostridium cylindrosporum DSM 605 TaxID=1121307 RepID=A0A0J8DDS2_CLOCY|nr:ZIP family metal transporter [Clostridium cylindrosporum]KMT22373.1 putative divalent heavy-metal cations transporter [Clostridium cylindrosporum DSM 605]